MKQIITILATILFGLTVGQAQSSKFEEAMKKNLDLFDSCKTTADYQKLAASFERIGDAEKNQWLPYYYAALSLTMPGWSDAKLDKDQNAERIKAICDKAEALVTDNDDKAEIMAIRNMTATQQMLVDPQSRWMSYGQESGTILQNAMKLSPQNPRLLYLQGAGLFGTPEQFGGGKAKAKPVLQKAVDAFNAFEPKPFHPRWGKQQAEEMLAQCDQ